MDAHGSPGAFVTPLGLVLALLATWRVTHLLQAEDGPAKIFVRLRRAVGDGVWGSLLDCFYCLSLWIAAPFAIVTGSSWSERGMLWLALSGGACLLERWKPSTPAALYAEDPEEIPHALLRQPSSENSDIAGPSRAATGGEPAAASAQPPPSDDPDRRRAGARSEPGHGAAP